MIWFRPAGIPRLTPVGMQQFFINVALFCLHHIYRSSSQNLNPFYRTFLLFFQKNFQNLIKDARIGRYHLFHPVWFQGIVSWFHKKNDCICPSIVPVGLLVFRHDSQKSCAVSGNWYVLREWIFLRLSVQCDMPANGWVVCFAGFLQKKHNLPGWVPSLYRSRTMLFATPGKVLFCCFAVFLFSCFMFYDL